jgi:hypothetical protein
VVLQNGKYTALVEVKYKAKARDIDKLLDDQIDALREGFKLPKEQKIIPAIATKILSDDVKNVAEKKGVVLMAQNGEELHFCNSASFKFKTY